MNIALFWLWFKNIYKWFKNIWLWCISFIKPFIKPSINTVEIKWSSDDVTPVKDQG